MGNKSVIIVQAKDLSDGGRFFIGAANSLTSARKRVREYYGEFTKINSHNLDHNTLIETIMVHGFVSGGKFDVAYKRTMLTE